MGLANGQLRPATSFCYRWFFQAFQFPKEAYGRLPARSSAVYCSAKLARGPPPVLRAGTGFDPPTGLPGHDAAFARRGAFRYNHSLTQPLIVLAPVPARLAVALRPYGVVQRRRRQ